MVQFHHERRRLSADESKDEATSSKGETTTTLPAISQLVQLVKRLSERKRSFLPWQEQRHVARTEEVTAEQEEEEEGAPQSQGACTRALSTILIGSSTLRRPMR